jgi:tripartite-type tricarboxylate transporter receptor subunit TctC
MRAKTSMALRLSLRIAVTCASVVATVLLLFGSTESAPAPEGGAAYPTKGKAITLIVPWAPGGPADTGTRILAPIFEKELGTRIEIVNRGGAATQIGMTELVRSKPDGYTIGQVSLPTLASLYLNPEREAVFTRESFSPIAMYQNDPGAIAVRADSPYKDLKSLVEAAKANPGKVKVAVSGVLSGNHLQMLLLEKEADARKKFAMVVLDSGAAMNTNLLGGHVDCASYQVSDAAVKHKEGQMRLIAVMAKERSPILPEVRTAEEQGYKIYWGSSRGWAAPAGTRKEIVEIFNNAVKRATENAEVKQKFGQAALALQYMGPEDYAKHWTGEEAIVRQLFAQEGVKIPKP